MGHSSSIIFSQTSQWKVSNALSEQKHLLHYMDAIFCIHNKKTSVCHPFLMFCVHVQDVLLSCRLLIVWHFIMNVTISSWHDHVSSHNVCMSLSLWVKIIFLHPKSHQKCWILLHCNYCDLASSSCCHTAWVHHS